MNEEDRPRIVHTVEDLQRRWRELLDKAPPHLMRLEFKLDEAVFHHCIKDIEKEIAYEEQVKKNFLLLKIGRGDVAIKTIEYFLSIKISLAIYLYIKI